MATPIGDSAAKAVATTEPVNDTYEHRLAVQVLRQIEATTYAYGEYEAALASGVNAYELAAARFSSITAAYEIVRVFADEIDRVFDEEYNAVSAELRRYEIKPGIPRSEYRRR